MLPRCDTSGLKVVRMNQPRGAEGVSLVDSGDVGGGDDAEGWRRHVDRCVVGDAVMSPPVGLCHLGHGVIRGGGIDQQRASSRLGTSRTVSTHRGIEDSEIPSACDASVTVTGWPRSSGILSTSWPTMCSRVRDRPRRWSLRGGLRPTTPYRLWPRANRRHQGEGTRATSALQHQIGLVEISEGVAVPLAARRERSLSRGTANAWMRRCLVQRDSRCIAIV